MKVILTKEESLQFFYNALCNGLSYMSGYGLELQYSDEEYRMSRIKLEKPCIEDVLIQMLKDGYKLTFVDIECDGENTQTIGLKEVISRVKNTPLPHLTAMITENDDADTADAILQTVFFKEIMFA